MKATFGVLCSRSLMALAIVCVVMAGCGSSEPVLDAGPSDSRDGGSGDVIVALDAVVLADGSGDTVGDTGAGADGGAGGDAAASDGSGGTTVHCGQCHGTVGNPAPPPSLTGAETTDQRGVGAHQKHLQASDWRAAIACEVCHRVPVTMWDLGHFDSLLPAEVTFSGAASAQGNSAGQASIWHGAGGGADLTCTTYCHGASMSGGRQTRPNWTQVGASSTCTDACHGLPPLAPHPSSARNGCATCHDRVVDAAGNVDAPALHVNGSVELRVAHPAGWYEGSTGGTHRSAFNDGQSCAGAGCHGDAATLTGAAGRSCDSCHSGWRTNCIFCHGNTDNTTGAPPAAVNGETAVSFVGVGRHTEHVEAPDHPAYACTTCHAERTDALQVGHVAASAADVRFGGIAGASASYAAGSCSNVYCHGNGQATGSGGASWTGSVACGGCHSINAPDLSGRHNKHKNYACSDCHYSVAGNAAGTLIRGQTDHVDGQRDIAFAPSISLTWNGTNCTGLCHRTHDAEDTW